ncbi:MAG: hypothetical protein LUD69_05565 [Oscillospiraceae bacterium]|nr:hypothetical protein [Oscillospiraceae bacterium]
MKRQQISALAFVLAASLAAGAVTAFAAAAPADANGSVNSAVDAVDTGDSADSAAGTEEQAAIATEPKGYVSVSYASTASIEDESFQEWMEEEEYTTVGWHYVSGDLIFEVVSDEEIDRAAAGDSALSAELSGDAVSQSFRVTQSQPYARVWIRNSGSAELVFTITEGSPDGSVVAGHCFRIPAGMSLSVYTSNKWTAGTYYVNFTSGQADMSGVAVCRTFETDSQLYGVD